MGFVVYKTSRISFKHFGFPDSIPGQPIWDLQCTKFHGFSFSTLVFPCQCPSSNGPHYIPSIYIISTTDSALQPTLLFLFQKPKYGGSNLLRTSEAICQWKRLGISRDTIVVLRTPQWKHNQPTGSDCLHSHGTTPHAAKLPLSRQLLRMGTRQPETR